MNTLKRSQHFAALCAVSAVLLLSSCSKKPDDTATSTAPSASPSPAASASPSTAASPSPSGDAMKSPEAKPTVTATASKLGVKPTNETTCPTSAPIKGKVTKKRGDIYHTTKDPDYAKVKPDICFKDTATAEKAGFRAPK